MKSVSSRDYSGRETWKNNEGIYRCIYSAIVYFKNEELRLNTEDRKRKKTLTKKARGIKFGKLCKAAAENGLISHVFHYTILYIATHYNDLKIRLVKRKIEQEHIMYLLTYIPLLIARALAVGLIVRTGSAKSNKPPTLFKRVGI